MNRLKDEIKLLQGYLNKDAYGLALLGRVASVADGQRKEKAAAIRKVEDIQNTVEALNRKIVDQSIEIVNLQEQLQQSKATCMQAVSKAKLLISQQEPQHQPIELTSINSKHGLLDVEGCTRNVKSVGSGWLVDELISAPIPKHQLDVADVAKNYSEPEMSKLGRRIIASVIFGKSLAVFSSKTIDINDHDKLAQAYISSARDRLDINRLEGDPTKVMPGFFTAEPPVSKLARRAAIDSK